jgi:hypothetical protein
MIVLYHRTTAAAAQQIVREGFRDAEGYYLTDRLWRGVWLSDVPLDSSDFGGPPDATTLLRVTVDLDEEALSEWEWVEEGKPYREWLAPAALVNAHGTVEILTEEEEWELLSPNDSADEPL